jgi:hypothetical protein
MVDGIVVVPANGRVCNPEYRCRGMVHAWACCDRLIKLLREGNIAICDRGNHCPFSMNLAIIMGHGNELLCSGGWHGTGSSNIEKKKL